ncbi:MAG: transposase [Paludibacteraceae bacterium]|nr:transposase [Paludibacteraceae bacterium]
MLSVEVEGVGRFRKSDKLVGYVGLVPTIHSSGEKDNKVIQGKV